jgi:hypothetical protein
MNANTKKLSEDAKKLVIARLRTVPPNIELVIGDEGTLSPSELIDHINNEDRIGLDFVEADLQILRSLKDGILYGENSSF